MLVAKCGRIRKLILESREADLSEIELPDFPCGPEIFQKAVKFCYGENLEITVWNVAALRCAAEYLEMSETYCQGNLVSRTEEFLAGGALTTFSGAIAVLKSCEDLLPMAETLNIVQRCVEVSSLKVRPVLSLSLYLSIYVHNPSFNYYNSRPITSPISKLGRQRVGGWTSSRSWDPTSTSVS